jgi:autophagy-related protein 2
VLRVAFLAYENPPIIDGDAASAADSPIVLEHRLYVRVLPLRCYLDEHVISFAKALAALNASPANATTLAQAEATSGVNEARDSSNSAAVVAVPPDAAANKELYFQSVLIAAVEIKIDYRASTVNVQALHKGDYLQMLNIFPLDGLEITLKHVKLNGVKGVPLFVQRMAELWVKDIYANQLHRVISGTAPFRGLSNIGNDLQELLAIPLRDYRKSGGTMKHLRRSTQTLVRTVARETLHATQQLTMFVANAISELASDSPAVTPPPSGAQGQARITEHGSARRTQSASSRESPSRRPSRSADAEAHHQPAGVVEGLQQAYGSVAREVTSAAETVIAVPIREYVHTGPGGYLKSVIRAFPIAVLRPVAGVVEGISYTMLGLRNDIDPGARLDEEDIWNVDIGAFPQSPARLSKVSYHVEGGGKAAK